MIQFDKHMFQMGWQQTTNSIALRIQNYKCPFWENKLHSGKLTWLAGKWIRIEDIFPIENWGYSRQLCKFTRGFATFSLGKRLESHRLTRADPGRGICDPGYMGMGFSLPFSHDYGMPQLLSRVGCFFQCRKTGTNHMEDHPNDL